MLTIHFLSVVTANASKNRFRENELFSENRTPLKFSFHDELFTSLFFLLLLRNKLLVGFRGGLIPSMIEWIGDLRQFYFLSQSSLSLTLPLTHTTHALSLSLSLSHDAAKFLFLFFNFKLISPGKLSSPWSRSRRTFNFSWELMLRFGPMDLVRAGWEQTWRPGLFDFGFIRLPLGHHGEQALASSTGVNVLVSINSGDDFLSPYW